MTKKALVLSGGGGRGAYHVGVIEALVEQGWMHDGQGPDIIAGTSIGAINAAALASGRTVAELKHHWLEMHTEDVHRLSNDLPSVARPLLRFLLHSVLTSDSHGGATTHSPAPAETEPSSGNLFQRLGTLFQMRPFHSLLDTTPWRYTLASWMDFERINSPNAPALLLTATDLQHGSLRIFCNRALQNHKRDQITIDHLMASSSIPAVYPPTTIEGNNYWDGAVIANTPLDAVISLSAAEEVDILVVMMSPWFEADADAEAAPRCAPPADLVQMLTLALDWTLLASYRTAINQLKQYNQLVEAAEKLNRLADQMGDDSLRMPALPFRRVALPTVIAPQNFMPMNWIVDYEEANHQQLFAMGKADAERILATRRSTD